MVRHSVGYGSVERARPPMAAVGCRGSLLSMRVAWAWAGALRAASDEGLPPPAWDRRRALADSRRGDRRVAPGPPGRVGSDPP